MKILGFFIFSVACLDSFAEYRAYQYLVTPMVKTQFSGTAYMTTSSLDPKSFVSYHGGYDVVKVETIRTWMCEGVSAGIGEICPGPLDEFYSKYKEELSNELKN